MALFRTRIRRSQTALFRMVGTNLPRIRSERRRWSRICPFSIRSGTLPSESGPLSHMKLDADQGAKGVCMGSNLRNQIRERAVHDWPKRIQVSVQPNCTTLHALDEGVICILHLADEGGRRTCSGDEHRHSFDVVAKVTSAFGPVPACCKSMTSSTSISPEHSQTACLCSK